MKKLALVFVLAVFVPSLVLAWLAIRSLRDQQVIVERQQSLLYQSTADSLAKEVNNFLADRQREFGLQVESLLADEKPREIAARFDEHLIKAWSLAEVGFVVSLDGNVYSPSLLSRKEARQFRLQNDQFLCSRETAQVYYVSPKGAVNLSQLEESKEDFKKGSKEPVVPEKSTKEKSGGAAPPAETPAVEDISALKSGPPAKGTSSRKANSPPESEATIPAVPKVAASEAEFRQLVGDANEGSVARFLQNRLQLLFWYRSPSDPQLVFGAQLRLPAIEEGLRKLIQSSVFQLEPALRNNICLALLDETGKAIAVSHSNFAAAGRRAFVTTEIGESLPHWEIAAYLLHPEQLSHAARWLRLYLSLLTGVLLLVIGIGGWLIAANLERELTLARQKTDFVSNVSHELKTPLTSIRMFSELLAEGRIQDAAKQQSYLNIIASEAGRLTRLINNVLDFSRLERGEKEYHFEKCDLVQVLRETVEAYRPHLEAEGFRLRCDLPSGPCMVNGDRDALAQIVVNLLSNAEKYSGEKKEIEVQVQKRGDQTPALEVHVLDRGLGVPKGCEGRIFEKFFRAHDALHSGIQGSGLGLTLACQIARAHGGQVGYEPREGGGSRFTLRLPIKEEEPL